ncbi:MAG: hypothetical protein ACD_15C00109G0003 [uncultured bacterium]|nr:MAG: hypothetical protein ACD_15C00109G0003 [uncultured bacterium]
MDKKNIFIWNIIFLAMVFFCPQISQAQESKITVDRGIIDLSSQSGRDAEFYFSVRNDSAENQKIDLSASDIRIGDDNVMEIVEAQGGPSSLVSFKEDEFVIKPHEIKSVSGVIKLSQKEKGASFYNIMAMVSFTGADKEEEASGPQASGKIGIHIFTKVGESHDASGKIEGISIPKILKENNELKVSYRNSGDIYFVPQGGAKIKNLLDGLEKDILLDKHFVFPGKKVVFSGKVEDISSWGFFRIKISFIDGNGKKEVATRYSIGYFFPIGAFIFLGAFAAAIILVLRKRNKVQIEMLEKKQD